MWKDLIAPIIIVLIIGGYYLLFFQIVMLMAIPVLVKFLLGVIPLCLFGVLVYVLVQRINEIRSGEEDDLSKY